MSNYLKEFTDMKLKNIFLSMALACSFATPLWAEPSLNVASSAVTFNEAVTPEMASEAQGALAEKKADLAKIVFILSKVSDNDLQIFAQNFPNAQKVNISGKKLTNIAPLASLKGLTTFVMDAEGVKDLSPLADLTKLQILDLDYTAEGQDLAWMSKLTNLKSIMLEAIDAASTQGLPSLPQLTSITLNKIKVADLEPLAQALPNLTVIDFKYSSIDDLSALAKLPALKSLDFYGATLKDFSPLANAPKLANIDYYAVKKADFATLGTLKQVKVLDGGLTALDSLAWIQDMPNLQHLRVFAEKVTDYTPLANAPNLSYLKIWSMKEPVGDLSFLTPLKNLSKLILDNNKGVTNFEAIGTLATLTELTLIGNNKGDNTPVSLAFLAKLANLTTLDIQKSTVQNFSVTGLNKLEEIDFDEVNFAEGQAPIDLATVKDLPLLETLDLTKCSVVNFQALANLPELRSVNLLKTKGITDLAPLAKLPKLKSLIVSKDAFTKEQLAVVPETVRVSQR